MTEHHLGDALFFHQIIFTINLHFLTGNCQKILDKYMENDYNIIRYNS